MTSINLNEKERKDLITKMKRETKPSRRLRMHIALLAADQFTPTEIARVLYCPTQPLRSLVVTCG